MDESLWASARDLLAGIAEQEKSGALTIADESNIESGPTRLLDYAAYFDLALPWPVNGDEAARVKARAIAHLHHRLSSVQMVNPQPRPPAITNFSTEYYSLDQLDQMRRWWDIEPANRMALIGASDEEIADAQRGIATAITHLRNAAPELAGEVETIVRDIVLTRADGSNLINYSGASSFALWGAITINAETQREWMQYYRQIVHEAAHNLLFAIAREQPLITNDPIDRHASPLRSDPRPMDGIFHAVFVSAREALAFDALLVRHETAPCLTKEEAGVIEDMLEMSVLAFWDGTETLRQLGELSKLGERVLEDCEAYMRANFTIETC